MREVVLDTETTGLDVLAGHRIVEIGCVELINHVQTGESWQAYLNPQRENSGQWASLKVTVAFDLSVAMFAIEVDEPPVLCGTVENDSPGQVCNVVRKLLKPQAASGHGGIHVPGV